MKRSNRKRPASNKETKSEGASGAAGPSNMGDNNGSSAGDSRAQKSVCRLITPAPYSHEEAAVCARAACDYSIKITMEMARSGSAPRPVRVYADGVYDMFHSGHARQLMQAKLAFPNTYLIVGVNDDASTKKMKGNTVMNEAERYEAVRHCRYVDEVLTGSPWSYEIDHIEANKIDFVAHDDIPYETDYSNDVYGFVKDKGMFLPTQRTEGISTTDVIARIVRDYDIYLRRNMSRGLSRKDLNISYMKEKRIQMREKYESIVKKGSDIIQTIDSKRRRLLDKWERKSHDLIQSFIGFFGADGRVLPWWPGQNVNNALAPTSPVWSDDSDSDSDELNDEEVFGSPSKRARVDGPEISSSLSIPTSSPINTRRKIPQAK